MLNGKAKTGGGQDFPQATPGNHVGLCVGVIDLGTHWERFLGGNAKKTRKVLLVWEVDTAQNGPPVLEIVGRDFNVAYDKDGNLVYGDRSHLRQALESWRGQPYASDESIDLGKLLGTGCQINIVSEQKGDRTFSRVKTLTPLGRGQKTHVSAIKPICYEADSDQIVPDMPWLPLVYGETVAQVLERCLEHNGSGEREPKPPAGYAGVDFSKLAAQKRGNSTHPQEPAMNPRTGVDEIPF